MVFVICFIRCAWENQSVGHGASYSGKMPALGSLYPEGNLEYRIHEYLSCAFIVCSVTSSGRQNVISIWDLCRGNEWKSLPMQTIGKHTERHVNGWGGWSRDMRRKFGGGINFILWGVSSALHRRFSPHTPRPWASECAHCCINTERKKSFSKWHPVITLVNLRSQC